LAIGATEFTFGIFADLAAFAGLIAFTTVFAICFGIYALFATDDLSAGARQLANAIDIRVSCFA
jgi:hypothetical protein